MNGTIFLRIFGCHSLVAGIRMPFCKFPYHLPRETLHVHFVNLRGPVCTGNVLTMIVYERLWGMCERG